MAASVNDIERNEFELVHPLYDAPEVKRSAEGLGRIPLHSGVRMSLFLLRAYLFVMMLLVLYSVLHQAGVFGH